jgi:hypothetical protein
MNTQQLLGLGAARDVLVLPGGDQSLQPVVAQSYTNNFGSYSVPQTIGFTPTAPSAGTTTPFTSPKAVTILQSTLPVATAISSGIVPPNAVSYLLNKKIRVVDENGKALPNAIAYKNGEKSGAVADASGVITLTSVEASANIFISHQGYTPQSFTMAALPATVALKSGMVYLEGPTVTALPEARQSTMPQRKHPRNRDWANPPPRHTRPRH